MSYKETKDRNQEGRKSLTEDNSNFTFYTRNQNNERSHQNDSNPNARCANSLQNANGNTTGNLKSNENESTPSEFQKINRNIGIVPLKEHIDKSFFEDNQWRDLQEITEKKITSHFKENNDNEVQRKDNTKFGNPVNISQSLNTTNKINISQENYSEKRDKIEYIKKVVKF